jgi:hypothetical protein
MIFAKDEIVRTLHRGNELTKRMVDATKILRQKLKQSRRET